MNPQDWATSFTVGYDDLDTIFQMEVNNRMFDPADTIDLDIFSQMEINNWTFDSADTLNLIIAKETQTITSSLEEQAVGNVEDDRATGSCQPATPQFVTARAAGQPPDVGRSGSRNLQEQLMVWETDKDRENVATSQPRDAHVDPKAPEDANHPLETLTRFANDRKARRSSKPLVSLANGAEVEPLREPCLSVADSEKVNQLQKPSATPSNDKNAEQPQELPVSFVDVGEIDQTHAPSATNADDRKTDRTSKVLQAFCHEEARVVISPTPSSSSSVEKQRATSTDESRTTLKASLSARVYTSNLVSMGAALEPLLPKRSALVAPKALIQNATREEPIVIDSSCAEQEEEDSSGSEHGKRSSTSSRIRSRPQRSDGIIMWTDPKVEKQFLRKTRNIWYHIQSQWIDVQQLPGLGGMPSVIHRDNLINAIASNLVKNNVLAHDDVIMLRNRYERVANQAISKLSAEKDRTHVRSLKRYMDQFHDESQIVKLITDYPIKDNEEDVDYRPS
ncbi:hypothetical protein P171DRAFT_501233 [Karstenula rhodostoma CBS 690.94]|uniref:Uncharacterized protein n=1 Tax=Karstenula rhodostoma CBS 690.94 TaxID=1392251 RepID=A0A9P4P873_9PLEO|nr:hypothetical protein P171DRAFT_501233 [Karstenula rhodostoma CBS 690.94]